MSCLASGSRRERVSAQARVDPPCLRVQLKGERVELDMLTRCTLRRGLGDEQNDAESVRSSENDAEANDGYRGGTPR